jgi:hypothetical protein
MQTNTGAHNLTPNQIENPCLVFYELFDYASLPQIREHLWQWLKLTVTGGYTKKYFDYRERESILTLYEHLEKLIEASWIIYSDRKEELRKLHHQILDRELNTEEY